jgi:hypothetical protein
MWLFRREELCVFSLLVKLCLSGQEFLDTLQGALTNDVEVVVWHDVLDDLHEVVLAQCSLSFHLVDNALLHLAGFACEFSENLQEHVLVSQSTFRTVRVNHRQLLDCRRTHTAFAFDIWPNRVCSLKRTKMTTNVFVVLR